MRRVWSLFFDLEKLQDLRPHSALGKSVSTDGVGLHVRFQKACGRNLKAKEQRAKAWLLLRPLLENVSRAGNLLLKAEKKHKKSPSPETEAEKTRLKAIFEAAKQTLSDHYADVKDTEKEYPQLDLMELLPGKPYTSFKKKLANYENLFHKSIPYNLSLCGSWCALYRHLGRFLYWIRCAHDDGRDNSSMV